jgi:hypothetical protein
VTMDVDHKVIVSRAVFQDGRRTIALSNVQLGSCG